ncbi:hypothetical protein [Pedobacter metabolipauper]|uniref:hypothetical protein n=1 Tax=Pedobacter metabolipauper TaxID=425513 RepID=UPI001060849B|nr:hypothetical protein [Pedobacter metabolipauper]
MIIRIIVLIVAVIFLAGNIVLLYRTNLSWAAGQSFYIGIFTMACVIASQVFALKVIQKNKRLSQ